MLWKPGDPIMLHPLSLEAYHYTEISPKEEPQ